MNPAGYLHCLREQTSAALHRHHILRTQALRLLAAAVTDGLIRQVPPARRRVAQPGTDTPADVPRHLCPLSRDRVCSTTLLTTRIPVDAAGPTACLNRYWMPPTAVVVIARSRTDFPLITRYDTTPTRPTAP